MEFETLALTLSVVNTSMSVSFDVDIEGDVRI